MIRKSELPWAISFVIILIGFGYLLKVTNPSLLHILCIALFPVGVILIPMAIVPMDEDISVRNSAWQTIAFIAAANLILVAIASGYLALNHADKPETYHSLDWYFSSLTRMAGLLGFSVFSVIDIFCLFKLDNDSWLRKVAYRSILFELAVFLILSIIRLNTPTY